jgi:hypothetical protein
VKTIQEAHAAGRRDGEAGLGPLPPRKGPPGSLAARMHAAYWQSYRDALIARVGIPDRRRNPKVIPMSQQWGIYRQDHATGKMVRYNPTLDGKPRVFKTRKAASDFAYDYEIAGQRNSYVTFRRENPRGPKPSRKKVRRRAHNAGKTVTTTTRATVIRRTNRRPRRALIVLYATKPGMRRLKYLGHGKFGEHGRPMLFRSVAGATLAAVVLRDAYPSQLRGWTLKGGA